MVDVVGLRFVTEGEQAALAALDRYRKGLADTSQLQDRQVATLNRAVQREIQAFQNAQRIKERTLAQEAAAQAQAARVAEQAAAQKQRALQQDVAAFQNMQRIKERSLAEEKAAQAALARETEMLARAYNPVMAAASTYVQRQEQVNRAHQLGVLSADALQAELAQLQAAYAAVGQDATKASAFVNNFSAANTFAGRSMNASGMAMQQVGYQVGDFLVQVQSGTNAFVAFGQQATQLVGILPLFGSVMGVSGTALIGLTAALGIVIPLVTALGAAFVRTRMEARKTTGDVDDVESAIKSLDASLRQWMRTREAAARGVTVDELISVDALKEAEAAVDSIQKRIEDFQRTREALSFGVGSPPGVREGVAIADALKQRSLLKQENAAIEELMVAENRLADLRRKLAAEQFATFSERLQQYNDEIRLQSTIAKFGEDSDQARQVRLEQAIEAEFRRIDALRDANEITEAQAGALKRAAEEAARTSDAAAGIKDELSLAVSQANALTSALAAAASAGLSRQRQAAQLTAQIAAARAGTSTGVAAVRAGTEFDIRQVSSDPIIAMAAGAIAAAEQTQLEALQSTFDALTETGDGGGRRGRKRGDEDFTSRIAGIRSLQDAIEAAAEEAKAFDQEIKLLDSALDNGVITQRQYNDLLIQTQEAYGRALQGAYDYAQAIEQVNDRAMSSIEDGFMSMIDGSKSVSEAFRQMAQDILAEALRLLVVRPMIENLFGGNTIGGAIGSFLNVTPSARGNVFMGGAVVPFAQGAVMANMNRVPGASVVPFASGGVVSSPSFFPMAGGRTGLAGEAGPEAIIPLKRGRGGKLGVSAEGMNTAPVFNMTYNFQGGVTQADLARALPTLVEQTKRSVIDTVQRGGSTARVFK